MPPASAPTPPTPPAPPSPHPKPREVVMGAFVVVAAIVIAIILSPQWRSTVFPFIWPSAPEPIAQEQVVTEEEPEVLMGKIYMSLKPLKVASHFPLNLYTYDAESGLLEQVTGEEGREHMTSSLSPDGSKIAVATIENDGVEAVSMQLLFGDPEMTEMTEVTSAGDALVIKRNPSWSPDGTQIAFQGKEDKYGADQVVENWGVYLYDLSAKTISLVTAGINPMFLPDGALAVLKTDGIYRVDPKTKAENRVLEIVGGDAPASMKFDVSADGKRIVWAIPEHDKVDVIDVTSWAPFEAKTTFSIPTNAFWPTLSPKGDFVAMEVFDWETMGTTLRIPVNQRLAIFSLRDNAWSNPLDLMPFDQEEMFITDWR